MGLRQTKYDIWTSTRREKEREGRERETEREEGKKSL